MRLPDFHVHAAMPELVQLIGNLLCIMLVLNVGTVAGKNSPYI